MLPSPFIAHHLLEFDQQQISEQQQIRKQLIFGWSSKILFSSVKTLLNHWVMEDARVQLLLFSKKSWDGRFPFSKYPMCFSIQTPQNSTSSITFIGTSSSPRSFLLVQQHVYREQLSLCAFPVLKLPKTAVRNVARLKMIEVKRSLSHMLISFSPSSPSTFRSVLLGQPKVNYPIKNLFICCWIKGTDSPWSCIIPSCDARREQAHVWEWGHEDRKTGIFGGSPQLYQIKYSVNHSWRRTCWLRSLYWRK